MEKLALTCKTLYDKDYLDKIILLRKERHPVVIFKDIFDYFHYVKRFQVKIKNHVEENSMMKKYGEKLKKT